MPSFAKARASGEAGRRLARSRPTVATLWRQGGVARAAQRGVIAPETAEGVLLAGPTARSQNGPGHETARLDRRPRPHHTLGNRFHGM